jgi:hypothetical protein
VDLQISEIEKLARRRTGYNPLDYPELMLTILAAQLPYGDHCIGSPSHPQKNPASNFNFVDASG